MIQISFKSLDLSAARSKSKVIRLFCASPAGGATSAGGFRHDVLLLVSITGMKVCPYMRVALTCAANYTRVHVGCLPDSSVPWRLSILLIWCWSPAATGSRLASSSLSSSSLSSSPEDGGSWSADSDQHWSVIVGDFELEHSGFYILLISTSQVLHLLALWAETIWPGNLD